MTHPLTIWFGAVVTLAVFSYLAKDNLFYRLVQHAALGISVGFGLMIAWQQVLQPMWWSPVKGALTGASPASGAWWLLALVPGGLWYCQLSKRWFWMSRLVSGLFIGIAAGLAFKSQILLILPQIGASLKPLNPLDADGRLTAESAFTCFSNLVFLVGLLTTLLYFFFSARSDSPLLRKPRRVGRVMIMVALGAMFGNTVMTRMAYLIERLQFLYETCLVRLMSAA